MHTETARVALAEWAETMKPHVEAGMSVAALKAQEITAAAQVKAGEYALVAQEKYAEFAAAAPEKAAEYMAVAQVQSAAAMQALTEAFSKLEPMTKQAMDWVMAWATATYAQIEPTIAATYAQIEPSVEQAKVFIAEKSAPAQEQLLKWMAEVQGCLCQPFQAIGFTGMADEYPKAETTPAEKPLLL